MHEKAPPVRGVLRMEELVEPRAQHLLARAAHHLAEPVVDEGESALEVELGDARDGVVDDRAEALLAIAQRALCLRALEAGGEERVRHGVDLRHRRLRMGGHPPRAEVVGGDGQRPQRPRDAPSQDGGAQHAQEQEARAPITTAPSERQKGYSTTAVGTATSTVQPADPVRALAKVHGAPLRVRALMPAGGLHVASRGDGQRGAAAHGVTMSRVLGEDIAVRVHHRGRPLIGQLLVDENVPGPSRETLALQDVEEGDVAEHGQAYDITRITRPRSRLEPAHRGEPEDTARVKLSRSPMGSEGSP